MEYTGMLVIRLFEAGTKAEHYAPGLRLDPKTCVALRQPDGKPFHDEKLAEMVGCKMKFEINPMPDGSAVVTGPFAILERPPQPKPPEPEKAKDKDKAKPSVKAEDQDKKKDKKEEVA